MTRRQWKVIIGINILLAFVVLSPFLPGPSFMSRPTNIIYSLIQIGSLFGLLLIPIGLIWSVNQAKKNQREKKVLPILLWTIPTIAFVLSIWGAYLIRDFSRDLAIRNASDIIKAIELYKQENRQYPNQLNELIPKYLIHIPSPWVMGIAGYNYEKRDKSYNLGFNQNVIMGFNFEVVIYNPSDSLKPEGELQIVYNTGQSKWKYYIYD